MTTRTPSLLLSLCICLALLPSAVAHAQANLKSTPPSSAQSAADNAPLRSPALSPNQYTPDLQPVDQGIADRDPLSYSLRFLQSDTRLARDFEDLYLVPGRPDLYMRCDGAITAVFSRSEYTKNKKGTVALIPGGTIFHIGPFTLPPESISQSDPSQNAVAAHPPRPALQTANTTGRASGLVDNCISLKSADALAPPPAAQPNSDTSTTRVPLAIWNSDRYRRARLTSIITAAVSGASPDNNPVPPISPAPAPLPPPAPAPQ